MIIFYLKDTGRIIGTIDGRVHSKDQLNMWIGDKNKVGRLISEWKPIRWYDKNGKEVRKNSPVVFTADFEPTGPQKHLFQKFDKKEANIKMYRVDTINNILVENGI